MKLQTLLRLSGAQNVWQNVALATPFRLRASGCNSLFTATLRSILWTVILIGLFGLFQTGLAADAPPIKIDKVEPSTTQPGGKQILTFSDNIKVSSVKIGNAEASIVSQNGKSIEVYVPQNTPLGLQGIVVTPAEGTSGPITTTVYVAPVVSGLKAKDGQILASIGAIAGGEVLIQFGGNIPPEIKQGLTVKVGDGTAHIKDIQNDSVVIEVPTDLQPAMQESYQVRVLVKANSSGKETELQKVLTLRVTYLSSMIYRASWRLGAMILFIYLLYRIFYRPPAGQKRYTFVKTLLLEQENQTYSLSRAQFLAWLTVIVWCYMFLYFAHGLIEQDWSFPNLGGAIYTFLISLGTLIAAQATSKGMGAKGAGEVHPSPADLVVHGGVLALDRVQQVIWTLIALGMFLRITVTSYSSAKGLPEIPQELLALMGLSSAGYLGGKLVRGPGPVIEQVIARAGSAIVNIKGKHLSKEAFIWLDGVKLLKDNIKILADDPDAPLQYANELEVTLAMSYDDWNATDHTITVINDDAQRSDWRTGPEIVGVKPGAADNGKVLLTIIGARLAKGATIEIAGAPDLKPIQDTSNANLFTVTVDEQWPKEAHELIVTSDKRKNSYAYTPAAVPDTNDAAEGAGGGAVGGGAGAGGAAGGAGAADAGGAAGGAGAADAGAAAGGAGAADAGAAAGGAGAADAGGAAGGAEAADAGAAAGGAGAADAGAAAGGAGAADAGAAAGGAGAADAGVGQ